LARGRGAGGTSEAERSQRDSRGAPLHLQSDRVLPVGELPAGAGSDFAPGQRPIGPAIGSLRLRPARAGRGGASLPRGRRDGLAGAGRVPGAGSGARGLGSGADQRGPGTASAISERVAGRWAGAGGNRARGRGGLGALGQRRAGAQDFRGPVGPEGPGPGLGRDGRAGPGIADLGGRADGDGGPSAPGARRPDCREARRARGRVRRGLAHVRRGGHRGDVHRSPSRHRDGATGQ